MNEKYDIYIVSIEFDMIGTKERGRTMKISVEQSSDYPMEPKVVIQCQKRNEEVEDIIHLLSLKEKKLIGIINHVECILKPREVLYCESVDSATYLYTCDDVYRCNYSLADLEEMFGRIGYYRCSKSIVLNIHRISHLKSEVGNRIDACLENGEHIIISRRYAKELRAILKGGSDNE